MSRAMRVIVITVLCVLVATTASADTDYTGDLKPGDTFTWNGAVAGLNPLYFEGDAGCSSNPNNFCEYALLSYTNPVPADDADGRLSRGSTITITPTAAADFDLQVYASDADGTMGSMVGSSTAFPIDNDGVESVTASLRTTTEQPTAYLLVEVIHFANVGGYTGTATF